MNSLLIRQEDFSRAVQDIITVCEQTKGTDKGGLPHFFYIRIEGLGNAVKLSANNVTRRVEVLIRDNVSEHALFCVGVSGIYLKNLVSSLPKGIIGLRVNSSFYIESGSSSYELKVLPRDSFPEFDPVATDCWIPVNLGELFDSFAKISYCSSNRDGCKIYEKSVAITPENILCTDNCRLSYMPNTFISCREPILFPVESVKCMSTLFKGVKDGFMYCDGHKMHFSSGEIYANTSLYSDKLPNFKSVLLGDSAHSCVRISEGSLKIAVRRLASFVASSAMTKMAPGLFEFTEDKLSIHIDTDGYKACEELLLSSGVPVKMGLNLIFFHQALKTLGDDICIEIRGAEMPIVIRDGSGAIRNIIMPQKIVRNV